MTTFIWHSLLAMGAGILLNATPCVLPVMPFKVQAVLRDIGRSRTQRLGAAMAMLAGSLCFFGLLGGATLLLNLTWGGLFQSKAFIAGLSLMLMLGGLVTLLGWSMPLPQRVHQIRCRRYAGAAMAGVLAGILATPCGGPFMGAVLAYALTQPPPVSLAIFLSIGTGLVLPYMGLLAWPRLGSGRPITGPWTVQVKQLLGFVLITGAIFYSQSLVNATVARLLWYGLFAALAGWVLVHLLRSRQWSVRVLPMLAGTVCLGMAATALVASPATGISWRAYSANAVAQARTQGQPVLLEFTAVWCLNCKVLEKTTYADRRVVAAAREAGIVALRVDLTNMETSRQRLLQDYGGRALPYALLIDGRGRVIRNFTGLFGADTLTEALRRLAQHP